MKKVKFIYNPSAGETEVARRLDEIIGLYQRRGYMVVPYRLTFEENPYAMIHDIDGSYDHALVAGGDGTVNYVVNVLKRNNIDVPLAILPVGTANDFATLLGAREADIVDLCEDIIEGTEIRVDAGVANGKYYVNVLSCGLFTDISQKTPTILKNTFGKLAYYVGGIGEITRFRSMHLTLESDGGSFDGNCLIFFVFNGQTAGNLRIAYLSQLDDGLLDVLIVKGDSPIGTVKAAFQYILGNGPRKGTYPSALHHIRCSRLHAECDTREATDMDGQPGPGFPLDIVCDKDALRVIKPQQHKK